MSAQVTIDHRNQAVFFHMTGLAYQVKWAVVSWLRESVGQLDYEIISCPYQNCHRFVFAHRRDAVLFKLTWGGS